MFREGMILGGRYQLIECVAQGGMALIYRAHDLHANMPVAVKIMRPDLADRPEVAERLRHEAYVLARLRHPGIVSYVDFQVEAGSAYLVIVWVEGETLKSRLDRRDRPFALSDVAAWAEGLCDALAYLHRQGIVHRDVKSSNVLITSDNRPVLIDFSIATAASTAARDPLARTAAGTGAYMAPEQMTGDIVDARADLYALGTVLFELLTLARPFADVERAAGPEDRWERLLEAKTTRDPPSVARYRAGLPAPVVTAVDRALAREPGARWQTAQDLWAAWNGASISTGEVGPVAAATASQQMLIRRRRLGLVAAGMLAVASLAFMLVLGGGQNGTDDDRIGRGVKSFNVCHPHEVAPGATWTTCLESVAYGPQQLTVTLRWQATLSDPGVVLNKSSDAGNKNVYLLDNQGQKYDHVAVAGDAGRDVQVTSGQSVRGQYIFPMVRPERGPFTFVDDDVGVRLRFDLK